PTSPHFPYTTLFRSNIIWPNVVLPHHNVLGDFNNLAPSVSLSGYSKIQDHCFLGNNSCVNNHVCVQSYAYVGAGAYAAKDVPEQDRKSTRLNSSHVS